MYISWYDMTLSLRPPRGVTREESYELTVTVYNFLLTGDHVHTRIQHLLMSVVLHTLAV